MAKISFPFAVKYGERFYASHEALEVAESEIDKLVAMGAKVLEKAPKDLGKALEPKPTKVADKKPYKIPTPSKKEK